MRAIAQRISPCYCINMKRAANAIAKYYDQKMEDTGLTASQFSLLNDLQYLGVCTKSELAFHAKLDNSTITRNLKILQKKGIVEDLSLGDSRESQISLTEQGAKKLKAARRHWHEAQNHILEKVGPKRLEQLAETLRMVEEICV